MKTGDRGAFLGIVKQGATVKKEFTLKWNDAKPGNIKKVRYGDREAVFSVTDTGKAAVVDVEFSCAGSPGFGTGELVLELNDPASSSHIPTWSGNEKSTSPGLYSPRGRGKGEFAWIPACAGMAGFYPPQSPRKRGDAFLLPPRLRGGSGWGSFPY